MPKYISTVVPYFTAGFVKIPLDSIQASIFRLNLAQLVIGDHNQTGLFAPYPVSEYVWQWGKSTFLDCDRQSLDIFLSKYSDIQSVDESKKQSLVNIMAHLRDVLDNMRMTLMLTDATALGK